MIVRMKRITVIVQSKDIKPTLRVLREAGVLHIEYQNEPIDESVKKLQEQNRELTKAIEVLPDAETPKFVRIDPEVIVHRILDLISERKILLENLKKIKEDIATWKDWGDFDPELISDLKDKGISVQLCRVTKKEFRNIPGNLILEKLFRKGNILYCVAISREEIALPFENLSLPDRSLQEMFLTKEREEAGIKKIDGRLVEYARYKNALSLHKKKIDILVEFGKAEAGTGSFKRLSYLRGYCPVYNAGLLEKLATQEKWGLVIENPDENDNVPTLIKNPKWIEIIKPLFQMINIIPGYREVDISMWFLLFFSVFFGILIGDAGYGLIFFVINLICHVKFRYKFKDNSIFTLTYILSLCAIIWGVLSGTFFGQAYLPKRVEPLLPYLRDNADVQALCFFIGALHLSIAHAWRFIRKAPSLKAFSEAGWICMLWAAYFLAKSLILGRAFPEFGKGLLAVGAALIILFTNPTKNILRVIGSGTADFLLHVVSSFTDIVSYIRLFAVGAATVAVADAFNQMAFNIGCNNFVLGFLTAFVLLFGHTLNILLGAMALLVHGVRLNVLEFSSHLNMEWSGIEYAPFKERGD